MVRVYLADAMFQERSALRLLLLDMDMEIAGEADNCATALAETPKCHTDILIVDWELLSGSSNKPLDEVRRACPKKLIIILSGRLEARQQAAMSAGADLFISKSEMPECVAEHLLAATAIIRK
ncbi:MAG: response regulator [Anaerolineales bacterium]